MGLRGYESSWEASGASKEERQLNLRQRGHLLPEGVHWGEGQSFDSSSDTSKASKGARQ